MHREKCLLWRNYDVGGVRKNARENPFGRRTSSRALPENNEMTVVSDRASDYAAS